MVSPAGRAVHCGIQLPDRALLQRHHFDRRPGRRPIGRRGAAGHGRHGRPRRPPHRPQPRRVGRPRGGATPRRCRLHPRGRHHRNAARRYLGRPIRARAVRSADAARITLSHRTGRHRVQRRATLVGAAGAGRSGGPAAIRHARRRRAAGGDPSTQRRRTSLDHPARRRRAVDRLRTRPVRPPLATGPRHRVRRSPGFARTAPCRTSSPGSLRPLWQSPESPRAAATDRIRAGVARGHRLRADRRTPSRCADSIRHGLG